MGYAIKILLVGKLTCSLKGVNDCLMTIRLLFHHGEMFATIISAYAPTMTNTDETKHKFYEDFEYVISAVPIADKFIIFGDFNARVGQDSASWKGVLGKHRTGKRYNNGLLLLQTCAKHNLLITNTVFHLPTHNKTSWIHSRSKHWHLIDYVIVRRSDNWDVRVMRAMSVAECWTDHCLIISKLSIRVQPKTRPRGKKAPKRLNIMKLKDIPTKQSFVEALDERLDTILLNKLDVEAVWITLWDIVYSTAMECLGPSTRRHKDWFEENHVKIMDIIGKKCAPNMLHLHDTQCTTKKDALRSICSTVQLKLHEMQDFWLSARADEIQGYVNKNDIKNFYSSLKEIYCPTSASSFLLLSADGTKFISENKILERWAEHFDGVINRPSFINDKAIERLLQFSVNESLDVTPTLGEVQIAIRQLSNGKAPGSDEIPTEIYKEGGSVLTGKLLTLIQLIWMKEQLLQDFKDASIIHIYKWKGNQQACDNYYRISLLSISSKILARVLLNRLHNNLEHGLLPES